MKIKESVGKVRKGIENIKSKYEWESSRRKARELESLRKKRISLEGKAKMKSLKEKELRGISKAKKTLGKGKKKFGGAGKSGWTLLGDSSGMGMSLDMFGTGTKKKKKKKEAWTI